MELNKVVELIIRKDEAGLNMLYDNYSGALNGIIFRIVGSEKLAEEILQQTFLKIWDKMESYDSAKSSLFTWMSRIARNNAIDARRLKKFENNQKTDSIPEGFDIVGSNRENTSIDVQMLLKKLDPKQKLVLDCVYLEGYSQSEAALKLDIPLGTVKSRIRLALKELRNILKHEDKLFIGVILLIIFLIQVL